MNSEGSPAPPRRPLNHARVYTGPPRMHEILYVYTSNFTRRAAGGAPYLSAQSVESSRNTVAHGLVAEVVTLPAERQYRQLSIILARSSCIHAIFCVPLALPAQASIASALAR